MSVCLSARCSWLTFLVPGFSKLFAGHLSQAIAQSLYGVFKYTTTEAPLPDQGVCCPERSVSGPAVRHLFVYRAVCRRPLLRAGCGIIISTQLYLVLALPPACVLAGGMRIYECTAAWRRGFFLSCKSDARRRSSVVSSAAAAAAASSSSWTQR